MKSKKYHNDDFNTKISKMMSYLLRHGAVKEGLSIREDGYVLLSEMLNHQKLKSYKIDLALIKNIVETNDKKRYELTELYDSVSEKNQLFIRATQGHTIQTIEDEKLLNIINDSSLYPTVIHGTYSKFWDSIKTTGLKVMSRNHIHLAPGYPGNNEVISGMRNSCDLYIEIDMANAMKDGMVFYISTNNVVLTRGFDGIIPSNYFKLVTNNQSQILFKNDVAFVKKINNENKMEVEIQEEEKKIDTEDSQDKKIFKEQFDYLFVLDFEAQCSNNEKLPIQEIIEFPVVPINLKTNQIEPPFFHYYIKPTKIPILTDFCKTLTGITQEQVDSGIILEEALMRFENYLKERDFLNKKWMFCTCGHWDLLTCLPNETKKKGIKIPDYFKKWINIKIVFQNLLNRSGQLGMNGMLKELGLSLDGRHHSGIDDSKNIAKIILFLLEKYNWKPKMSWVRSI